MGAQESRLVDLEGLLLLLAYCELIRGSFAKLSTQLFHLGLQVFVYDIFRGLLITRKLLPCWVDRSHRSLPLMLLLYLVKHFVEKVSVERVVDMLRPWSSCLFLLLLKLLWI